MTPMSIEKMVTLCKTGDRNAQQLLYERFSGNLYRLMLRMVGANDADDLTQQVFLRVLGNIHRFSGRSRLDTWLYRVALNESLQFLRHRKRDKHVDLTREPVDRASTPQSQAEDRELLELSLQELDPELRAIFLLREVDKLSYREIASTLGIPEGTIASRLNRVRRLLREHLLEMGWEG